MRQKALTTTGLCLVLVLLANGCSTATMAAFGLSAHLYRTNTTFEVVLDSNYREVISAAPGAFDELSIDMQSRTIDLLEGEVAGLAATGESVSVRVVREAGNNSTVSIRVGVLGDEAFNWAIYRALKRQLADTGRKRLEQHKVAAAQ